MLRCGTLLACAIADGCFVAVRQGAADVSALGVLRSEFFAPYADGRIAVPGLVEPHIHLDKALIFERAPVDVSGTLAWQPGQAIADRALRAIEREKLRLYHLKPE